MKNIQDVYKILENFSFMKPGGTGFFDIYYLKGTRFCARVAGYWDSQPNKIFIMWFIKLKKGKGSKRISFAEVLSSRAIKPKYKQELIYYINYFE